MSYVAGVGSEIGRVGCFTDYVEANSNLEIVGPYYSQSQMATALNQTTDVLAANPDLKGIFGANEPTAVGMGRAIKQAGKAGICPCLTPSGEPYVTNRGGVITGQETLLMQGLPIDDLLLTRESEKQMADLAGNAGAPGWTRCSRVLKPRSRRQIRRSVIP